MRTKASTPSSRSAAPCGAGDKQWRTDNRVRRNGRAAKAFEDTHEESSTYRPGLEVLCGGRRPRRPALRQADSEASVVHGRRGLSATTQNRLLTRSGSYLAQSALLVGGVGGPSR